jgi:hypothetical protein
MSRSSVRLRVNIIGVTLCTSGVLCALLGGPLASVGVAASKTTKPSKKTVPKTTQAKKKKQDDILTATIPAKKKPNGKAVPDSVAGRDKFCDALFTFRATLMANLGKDRGPIPIDQFVNQMAADNVIAARDLGKSGHLPILRWAADDTANSYLSQMNVVKPKDTPPEQLDAVVTSIIADGLDGFSALNAYSLTRCNMMLYANENLEFDSPPADADTAKLFAAYEADAKAIAPKLFPTAPAAGKKWPRAALYSIEDTPPTTVP